MQALGIAALILSGAGVLIPGGYFISGISGVLAFFSGGKGINLGLSAVIINIINVLFLSPTLMISISGKYGLGKAHQEQGKTFFLVIMAVNIISLAYIIFKKYKQGKE